MGSKAVKFKDNSGNAVYPCPYYPVGSIYMSVNNINPANFFGGTWERLKSRFLLGADDSTYKLGGTGGSTTHKHTTGNHTLTVDEMPNHSHKGLYWQAVSEIGLNGGSLPLQLSYGGSGGENGFYTGREGGGKTHNHGNTGDSSNIPPYLSVYMWKRTA